MLTHRCHFLLLFVLLVVVVVLRPVVEVAATYDSLIGINYGRVGTNIPPPEAVLPLISSLGVGRVRIYDPEPSVLHAFANTGVELIVGLPDQCLAAVADPNEAAAWLRNHIQPFLPATKIAAIVVGNEVLTNPNSTSLAHYLLPAMLSIHAAVVSAGLDKQMFVTTTHSLSVLSVSYPPSSALFKKELISFMCPIISFLHNTSAPFLINAYPFFAYSEDPTGVDLRYALLDPDFGGVVDHGSGLNYMSLLHAQVDAVYHAIAAASPDEARTVEVRVSETGWPSAGDADETGASPQNAARYNGNLFKLVSQGKGTPLRPASQLRVYVFALFNENQKAGPLSEQNFGLYKSDGTPAYPLGITVAPENTTTGGNTGGPHTTGTGGGVGDHGIYDNGSDGIYSISGAGVLWRWRWIVAAAAATASGAAVAVLL